MFRILSEAEVAAQNRGPTIAEQIRARNCGYIDESTDPGENDSLSFPKQLLVFVRNFRGFQKGRKGRRHDAAFMDGVVIHNMPDFLPFDEVEDFCTALREIRDAGHEALIKAGK